MLAVRDLGIGLDQMAIEWENYDTAIKHDKTHFFVGGIPDFQTHSCAQTIYGSPNPAIESFGLWTKTYRTAVLVDIGSMFEMFICAAFVHDLLRARQRKDSVESSAKHPF